jgi:hypothetical protein
VQKAGLRRQRVQEEIRAAPTSVAVAFGVGLSAALRLARFSHPIQRRAPYWAGLAVASLGWT